MCALFLRNESRKRTHTQSMAERTFLNSVNPIPIHAIRSINSIRKSIELVRSTSERSFHSWTEAKLILDSDMKKQSYEKRTHWQSALHAHRI